MAKDPAFLFYPGDYLRDTQCLSEVVQVAYDRIMCEHMRNICITQQQLNFFTKKLTDEEKQELKMTLTEINGGYQITWVAESIANRRAYSQSRAENRRGKPVEDMNDISKSYVKHMENENAIRDADTVEDKKENKKIEKSEFQSCMAEYDAFIRIITGLPAKINGAEGKALKEILTYLKTAVNDKTEDGVKNALKYIFKNWDQVEPFIKNQIKLTQINSNLPNILNQLKNGTAKSKTFEQKLAENYRLAGVDTAKL